MNGLEGRPVGPTADRIFNSVYFFLFAGRRKSGDDVLSSVSPSRKAQALLDAFRPRSKSDASKNKKPTIISQMKNAMHVSRLLG